MLQVLSHLSASVEMWNMDPTARRASDLKERGRAWGGCTFMILCRFSAQMAGMRMATAYHEWNLGMSRHAPESTHASLERGKQGLTHAGRCLYQRPVPWSLLSEGGRLFTPGRWV